MIVEQVQLADIEDAASVPSDSDIVGKQVGNMMWRSPEGHAYGPINKPSDIFSFGIVVSGRRESADVPQNEILIHTVRLCDDKESYLCRCS